METLVRSVLLLPYDLLSGRKVKKKLFRTCETSMMKLFVTIVKG